MAARTTSATVRPPVRALRERHELMGGAVWSNFEIADLDFFRGRAYADFFDTLERAGGFYYEVRRSSASRGSM
jgi:hypothetical protein